MTVFRPGDRVHLKGHAHVASATGTVTGMDRNGDPLVRWDDNHAITPHDPYVLEPAGEPMQTDPRIEAAALEDATDVVWSRSMGEVGVCTLDRERDDYKDAEEITKEAITAYLAAADKAATISEQFQLDAAPDGTVLRDHWGNVAELAVYQLGGERPVRTWHRTNGREDLSVPLPATIIHWGTE